MGKTAANAFRMLWNQYITLTSLQYTNDQAMKGVAVFTTAAFLEKHLLYALQTCESNVMGKSAFLGKYLNSSAGVKLASGNVGSSGKNRFL